MKKIISIILICSMLLAFLTGCSYFDKTNEGEDGNKNDNTGEGNNTNNSTNGGTTDGTAAGTDEAPKGIPLDKESDVIESIIDFIYNYYADHDMLPSTLEYKIDFITQGNKQPFEIAFDKFDYYFICGYDNDYNGHPNSYGESRAKKCDWYRFDSADDIPEYYNNEKCAFIFQFNKASSIIDLLETGNTPLMEHFLRYEPEFKDGYNVKSPVDFGETIIYLCRTDYLSVWDEGTVYYSTSSYDYRHVTIPFVEIDGVKYTTILSKYVKHAPNGQSEYEVPLEINLGEYYDDFKDVIEVNKYSVDRDNTTDYYSCIKIYDLIEVMKKLISE